ncbi:MAG TPA: DUF222 domain-containing protein [Ilumatobacteraceae bacterium]|nr:DUF222 domain-containing protein [Ilumatobacteraceae bacterium]
MEIGDVIELAGRVAPVDVSGLDRAGVGPLIAAVDRLAGWVEGVRVAVAGRLEDLADVDPTISPEHAMARSGKQTFRQATRSTDRARTGRRVPELGAALADGRTTAEHVDVVTNALRQLEPGDRQRLAEQGPTLALLAENVDVDAFRKRVNEATRQLRSDDGTARLAAQRRATKLSFRSDLETGMVVVRGQFDPDRGSELRRMVVRQVEAMSHGQIPDDCPSDPIERQQHLNALALIELMRLKRVPGGSSVAVVVDLDTLVGGLHDRSIVSVDSAVDLPVDTIRRMACDHGIVPVVMGGPGHVLDVGRTQRLATPAQRAALRTIYDSCAIPGCAVLFDQTTIHHLTPWIQHGPTDLIKLLPLCSTHHHAAHEGHWLITLDPADRSLTYSTPDGTTHTGDPPTLRAHSPPGDAA